MVDKLAIFISLLILHLLHFCHAKERVSTSTRFYSRTLDDVYSQTSVRESRPGKIMASIGNGHIGTIVYSDTMHISGLYNGRAVSRRWPIYPVYLTDHTHRARIPSTCAVNYTVWNINGTHWYALDVSQGVFYHWFESDDQNVHVEQRIYAHRSRKSLFVVEFVVKNNLMGVDIILNITKNMGRPSTDILFQEYLYKPGVKVAVGQIKNTEDRHGFETRVAMVWNDIPSSLIVKTKKRKWFFITSLSTNLNYRMADVVEEAKREWKGAARKRRKLLGSHKQAWSQLWKSGKIDIEGNLELSQAVYGSMYYILSSIRSDWPYGLSPGGLPGGEEYMGHTFWDQDIWMYPFLVLLYPDLARSCLQYRYERLPAARLMAHKYGFEGAMFPWESSLSGLETSPGVYYGECQVHISGDIAHAAKLYWRATKDHQWLKEIGYQLAKQTAEFWASRVYYKRKFGKYVIDYVMPPDEFHFPVDNSVYTNVIAKQNLQFAIQVSKSLGRYFPPRWSTIVDKMYIPFDKKLNYHPEFDGFTLNKTVKQADTILIGYPLMFDMNKQVRLNDLRLYSNVTSKYGPAMTHSMHAIGWLELGQEQRAYQAFKRNFDNIEGPFKVWTELINRRGAVNFITGAGGFLQAVLFGYGGFRFRADHLDFNPTLPPTCTKLTITGVHYLGNKLQFTIKKKRVRIMLTNRGEISPPLEVVFKGKKYSLKKGKSLNFARGHGVVRMSKNH